MNFTPARLYLVEDEALIALELQDRLTFLGYEIAGHAANGELAIKEVIKRKPDAVLMDINLADETNGIECAAQIREQFDVPIIFLTAYSDNENLRKAGETFPYGYLVKPFEERELHATIQVALHLHEANRKLRESNRQLEEALDNVKQLEGLVPICMHCKRIRDPKDYWHQIESYLAQYTKARPTHGLCPQCFEMQIQELDRIRPISNESPGNS